MSQRPPSSPEPAEARDGFDEYPVPTGAQQPATVPADSRAGSAEGSKSEPALTPAADPRPSSAAAGGTGTAEPGAAPATRSSLGPDGGFAAGPATKDRIGTTPSPAGNVPEDGARHRGRSKGPFSFLKELPALIIIAFLLALLIKSFLVQAFYIPSESMVPTLHIGDRVLVNKLAYKFNPPSRGDVIVFSNPHPGQVPDRNWLSGFFHWVTEGLGFSAPEDEDFIKRVIGLPGDTVEQKDGVVFVNGKPLDEPYLNTPGDKRDSGPFHVQAGHLFVMGDNRSNSNDSRFDLGQIPIDNVIGKAFIIIWPPGDFGGLADGTEFALAFP